MLHNVTREFIRAIPKTDLHVHLDGSLRLATLIELAPSCGVTLPSYEEAGMRELVFKEKYKSLPEYLQGFAYTCGVLQSAENLERVARELAEDCLEEGVRYVEVRFAPQLHVRDGLEPGAGRARGLRRHESGEGGAQRVHRRSVRATTSRSSTVSSSARCAPSTRTWAPTSDSCCGRWPTRRASACSRPRRWSWRGRRPISRATWAFRSWRSTWPARKPATRPSITARRISTPTGTSSRRPCTPARPTDPESIFQAITECHANRIGHGTFLFAADMVRDADIEDPIAYTRLLAEYIASQRITIEVCLTSNLQTTPEIRSMAEHPVLKMIDYGMSVTICTDNRLVSNTTVSRELELVADELTITRSQFRNLVVAGFKGSFFPGSYRSKRAYVRRVIDRYERLERDLLGE